MSFQFRVRPEELAVQLTGAAEAAITDGMAVGDWTSCRCRFAAFRTYRVYPAHGFTFPSIIEEPCFEIYRACCPSKPILRQISMRSDPMYGHGSVLTGKAISAVFGERRGRLKKKIKAYRQLSAIQPL